MFSLAHLFYAIILFWSAAYLFRTYNHFVFVSNQANKAFANIDIIILQRNNEVLSLKTLISELSAHEKTVFASVVELRNAYETDSSLQQKVSHENSIMSLISSLFMRIESNPKLVSGELYRKTAARMEKLESQIADQRHLFNDTVEIYNTTLQQFPKNYLAKLLGFSPLETLNLKNHTVENANEKLG